MDFVGKLANGLKDIGGKLWGGVKDIAGKAWDTVKNYGQHLSNAFKYAFQAIANTVRKINPLSRPLELGEFHFFDHNYTGPGTRIDLFPNAPTVNNIDNVSRIHDLEYGLAKNDPDPVSRAKKIQAADAKAIVGYNKYPNESGYKAAVAGIAGKFGAEQALSIFKGKPSVFYP